MKSLVDKKTGILVAVRFSEVISSKEELAKVFLIP